MDIVFPKGGVLIGLGADLVEVDRIRGVLERQGDRFLKRVFTEEERDYCMAMKYPHKHLAARFAAKEAVSKAFTTGIGAELRWTSVSIYKGPRDEPLVRLDELGQALLRRAAANSVLVSLSHTDSHAFAVAALLRE
jgi:holo-[acyl-carrier protein] synthase